MLSSRPGRATWDCLKKKVCTNLHLLCLNNNEMCVHQKGLEKSCVLKVWTFFLTPRSDHINSRQWSYLWQATEEAVEEGTSIHSALRKTMSTFPFWSWGLCFFPLCSRPLYLRELGTMALQGIRLNAWVHSVGTQTPPQKKSYCATHTLTKKKKTCTQGFRQWFSSQPVGCNPSGTPLTPEIFMLRFITVSKLVMQLQQK